MSATQTMEAVSTTVSTLMVLTSVSVEMATDCQEMEGTALVCTLVIALNSVVHLRCFCVLRYR